MLTISLLLAPLALLGPFFVPQYWKPDSIINSSISIEDFIFCFSTSGIMAVLYEIVSGKVIDHRKLRDSMGGELGHAIVLGSGLVVGMILYFFLKINFIYAIFLGSVVNAVIIVAFRRDLFIKTVYTGILFGLMYFVLVLLFVNVMFPSVSFWNEEALSGIVVARVPVEEIMWALGAGAMTGPMYEFLLSTKLVVKKR